MKKTTLKPIGHEPNPTLNRLYKINRPLWQPPMITAGVIAAIWLIAWSVAIVVLCN